jgi:hypothetical protein
MSNFGDDDDTSTGRITQGGRDRPVGGAVWWLLAVVAVALALGLWWSPRSQVAPAERGAIPVTGVGGGAGARVQTPAGAPPGGASDATAADGTSASGGTASGAPPSTTKP